MLVSAGRKGKQGNGDMDECKGRGSYCFMSGVVLSIGRNWRTEGMNCEEICRRGILGRGKSECKGLEAGVCWHFQGTAERQL